jgi:hypothetical protein
MPHPCTTCFLYETRGVCPMARDAYGLETPAEIQRRAEVLRLAIAQDAHAARGLFDLLLREGQRQRPAALPASSPLALPSAPTGPVSTDSRKERIRAIPTCPTT